MTATTVQLENYRQPPFNSTLLGVLRAAADYHRLPFSTPWLYGASGHAFLMNIHKELCPSGPYCWIREPFFETLANLGLRVEPLGFYHTGSTPAERAALEARLRRALDAGTPCMCDNMEFQTINGYDGAGLLCGLPWGEMDVTPGHISWGSWREMGAEVHASFYTISACPAAPADVQMRAGIAYALDLYARPERHTSGDYAVGAGAWEHWLGALRSGKFNQHGNWWNASVWSECRKMAGDWLRELAGAHPAQAAALGALAADYDALSGALLDIGDKDKPVDERLGLLEEARDREAHCVHGLGGLANSL